MAVEVKHAAYKAVSGKWSRCSDVFNGQDSIHAAGESYLPKLKDQDADDYAAYVKRAAFYNATFRTISGMVGMIFRKPPIVTVPPSVEPLLKDVTLSGISFGMFGQSLATEVLKLGRVGVLVDYPMVNSDQTTQADARNLNLRPSLAIYHAAAIINWRTEFINNRHTLTMVVLEEQSEVSDGEFNTSTEKRWRVLDLFNGQVYRVRIFIRKDNADIQIGDDLFPKMNGAVMNFIPFQFIGADSVSSDISDPPLIDLVDMNLSHYRTTADLEHGAHFTGLPTPIVTGYTKDAGEKLYIGSTSAWVFPNADASASFLEFKGDGLGVLERMLERKEKQMAVLGSRMLEDAKRVAETEESQNIHRKGEESSLANVAQVLELGLLNVLRWFTSWAGADGEGDAVDVKINRDFFPISMSPQELTALIAAWQSGAFSDQTLFENLQRGEVISEKVTLEDEQGRIANAGQKFAANAASLDALLAGRGIDANAS